MISAATFGCTFLAFEEARDTIGEAWNEKLLLLGKLWIASITFGCRGLHVDRVDRIDASWAFEDLLSPRRVSENFSTYLWFGGTVRGRGRGDPVESRRVRMEAAHRRLGLGHLNGKYRQVAWHATLAARAHKFRSRLNPPKSPGLLSNNAVLSLAKAGEKVAIGSRKP